MKKLSNVLELAVPAFLEEAEENASIEETALEAFALEHDLDEEELAEVRAELEAREVEIVVPPPAPEQAVSSRAQATRISARRATRASLPARTSREPRRRSRLRRRRRSGCR